MYVIHVMSHECKPNFTNVTPMVGMMRSSTYQTHDTSLESWKKKLIKAWDKNPIESLKVPLEPSPSVCSKSLMLNEDIE